MICLKLFFKGEATNTGMMGQQCIMGRGEGDFPSFFPVTPIYPSSLPRAFW